LLAREGGRSTRDRWPVSASAYDRGRDAWRYGLAMARVQASLFMLVRQDWNSAGAECLTSLASLGSSSVPRD
jgi:hypothetical protein